LISSLVQTVSTSTGLIVKDRLINGAWGSTGGVGEAASLGLLPTKNGLLVKPVSSLYPLAIIDKGEDD
jgi:hypothetical protein